MDENKDRNIETESEKELLEKIRNSASKAEIPQELLWENMQKQLWGDEPEQGAKSDGCDAENGGTSIYQDAGDGKTEKKRKANIRLFYKWGAAAAVLVFVLAGAWQVNRLGLTTTQDPKEPKVFLTGESGTEEVQAAAKGADTTKSADVTENGGTTEAADAAEQAEVPGEAGMNGQATEIAEEEVPVIDGMAPAESYEEVYSALEKYEKDREKEAAARGYDAGIGATAEAKLEAGAIADGAVEDSASKGSIESAQSPPEAESAEDYSTTNIQEKGVDEGDIVKTDGKYLYVLDNSGTVRIVSADKGNMEETGRILIPEMGETVQEMYLDGDRLCLVASGSTVSLDEREDGAFTSSEDSYVKLYTYNITDRTMPKLEGSVTQDGYYQTSRKNGNYVYLFTQFMPQIMPLMEDSSYIPRAGTEDIKAGSIYLPKSVQNENYLVISGTDIRSPEDVTDAKALVSSTDNYYVSTDNIFICLNDWKSGGQTTQIIKFHYEDGKITPVAAGSVNGYINNTFSLNEYKGYLRIVTTAWDDTSTNALYILNESMDICAKLENLAKGETIQSARFMGDIGYFVTYKQTDPLFSVDLKDPKNPKVLGELKVSGFSSYLHFYGEDKLLGIGTETDPQTGEWLGVKFSMFNTSDPSNVLEEDKYVMQRFNDCPGVYNYKAVMIDPGKNLFGLSCMGKDSAYMVFSYDEEQGFINKFSYYFDGQGEEYYDSYSRAYDARGIYIGNTFYLIYSDAIRSYDMENGFTQISKLVLE